MLRPTTFALALLVCSVAFAQRNPNDRRNNNTADWQTRSSTLGGGLEFGLPLGEFNNTWGKPTFGLSAAITLPMRWLPLEFGYDFGWGRMGGDYTVQRGQGNILGDRLGNKVQVNSNIYNHHGLIRLSPLRGKVRPYGDALLGARHFVTRSVAFTEEEATSEEKDGSIAGSYGWAVGAMVGLSDQFYVEGRVERLYSGKVDYVDPATIAIGNDGAVTYQKLSSRTDAVQVQIGLGIRF